MITILSFSFKNQAPYGYNIIDCRAIKNNPHSNPEYHGLDASDIGLREYVLKDPRAKSLLQDALQAYIKGAERIAFGCSYGQHRSVVMAREFKRMLDVPAVLQHRDLIGVNYE
ncbi:hypothetical protein EKI60_05835 [Candidatus Saccharibacteria bacterium]|nr:MAG: hypothetical protein EKI60_05835 [Candidatus Saccharibacteria bacterium]